MFFRGQSVSGRGFVVICCFGYSCTRNDGDVCRLPRRHEPAEVGSLHESEKTLTGSTVNLSAISNNMCCSGPRLALYISHRGDNNSYSSQRSRTATRTGHLAALHSRELILSRRAMASHGAAGCLPPLAAAEWEELLVCRWQPRSVQCSDDEIREVSAHLRFG